MSLTRQDKERVVRSAYRDRGRTGDVHDAGRAGVRRIHRAVQRRLLPARAQGGRPRVHDPPPRHGELDEAGRRHLVKQEARWRYQELVRPQASLKHELFHIMLINHKTGSINNR